MYIVCSCCSRIVWVVGGVGMAIDDVTGAAYYRQSSIFEMEDDMEVGGSISPSIYGKVLKFDALADMEPLHIEKSSDLPNERPIFILKLHFNSNLEPPYSFWRWNRTSPKISPKSHKITILYLNNHRV